jgi:transglutaminase-like putative cysteine protease
MMRRHNGTDGSLLGSLPWTLAALTFTVLPHLRYLPVWITLIYLACAAGRWQIERKRWHLPAAWIRLVLALCCFIGVLASFDSISGVGPGSALLVVMAALKLLETRQRRDQFVLLFISIFLVMSSLLREQYLLSLPYLVFAVLLTMTAWLQMSMGQRANIFQAMRNSARLLLYATPLMLTMWIFFPRLSNPFWAVPIDTSRGVSGLSDQMSPGDLSSLSLSDAVAFRVKFDDVIPEPRQRYWRGLILNKFNGRTWFGSEPINANMNRPVEYYGDPVKYQVTMEPTRQHWVYALDIAFEWSLDKTFMGQHQELARTRPIDQRIVFSAVSYPQFLLNPDLPNYSRRNSVSLPPDNSNPRTTQLARNMRRDAGSDTAFIDNVMRKFHEEEYFYTLEPPALGSNSVDEFLFESRRGFCEHYASAFAVMMRAAGLPARVVLGYQGGELNPMGDYMIIRQSDAHAWTEVWLEDSGWTRADPTSAVAPERIDVGMSSAMFDPIGASWGLTAPSAFLHQALLTWDAINAAWNDWVLGYGPEKQNSFMEWLGMEDPNWRKMMLTLLALFVVIVMAISFLLIVRYRPPAKDKAAILYRQFTKRAKLEPNRGESPLAYAARLGESNASLSKAASDVTDRYLAARYGPPSEHSIVILRQAVNTFSRNLV